jgi:hypothetical protein
VTKYPELYEDFSSEGKSEKCTKKRSSQETVFGTKIPSHWKYVFWV